jgi:hypothetical protein
MTVIYVATAVSTGSGRGGHVETTDGKVRLDLAYPKELGRSGVDHPPRRRRDRSVRDGDPDPHRRRRAGRWRDRLRPPFEPVEWAPIRACLCALVVWAV